MKKIIVLVTCLLCAVGLSGCDANHTETNISSYFDYCFIEYNPVTNEKVFYDKNTGIMYYYLCTRNGGITPIYNADGTLKIYEEE